MKLLIVQKLPRKTSADTAQVAEYRTTMSLDIRYMRLKRTLNSIVFMRVQKTKKNASLHFEIDQSAVISTSSPEKINYFKAFTEPLFKNRQKL